MNQEIKLTKAEQIARDHFILVLREGSGLPCDYDISAVEAILPSWYNEVLFQRGQNYFQQNRAGILNSNLIGLICHLAEPKGLKLLQSTGKSSSTEPAGKRYISTIAHALSWYDMDLTPGSKSFESLKKVRKLHYLSSKAAETKGIGAITQAELATTTFGFMGFALLRPHMLGIRYDNEDDRKAFVHFWAVISYMIGVHDRFNVCLLPFDAVIVFCQIFMRYVLVLVIQLEIPDFKDMTQAMLKDYLSSSSGKKTRKMSEGIELNKAERIAKEFVTCHLKEGTRAPFNLSSTGYELPAWYDREKFRRGQKYFHTNQHGMMFSSFSAVFSLMCIPKGLKTLIATGLTNSAEAARKRYLATLAFTLIWYKSDLEPDSESIELLKKVRKMHYHGSRSAKDKGFGHINQTEITLTAFGFMGFTLVRSHVLEINDKCLENQEGLIHFWAVISYMLGVEDRFNMCLLPMDALCEVCKIIIRYFLLPMIQIETTEFKQMALALINGLKTIVPVFELESQLFQAKRLLQVPGYQYKVDKSQEMICRSIFSQKELDDLKRSFQDVGYIGCMLLTADIPIVEVEKDPIDYDLKNYRSVKNIGTDIVINDRFKVITTEYMKNLREEMSLSSSEFITIRFIQAETEWFSCLNDSKFNTLSWFAKLLTYLSHASLWIYNFKIGRLLIDVLLNFAFRWIIYSSIGSKRKRKIVKRSS